MRTPSPRPLVLLAALLATVGVATASWASAGPPGLPGVPEPAGVRQGPAAPVPPACADAFAAGARTFCAPLVPVPDLRHVTAVLELEPPVGPFGVAVTRDGRQRHRLRIRVEDLPDPSALGPYTAYVVWITDLALGSPRRAGAVTNGVNELGEVARNQFRVLVSAEAGTDGERREGPLVLRGTSPSTGLLAHRDAVVAAGLRGLGVPAGTPGADGGDGGAAGHAGHTGHTGQGDAGGADTRDGARGRAVDDDRPPSGTGGAWPMPPMDPAMPMMPGVAGREPAVAPYLPGAGVEAADLPLVRHRTLLDLEDGDSLVLEAGLVRKVVGRRTLVMYAYNGQHPGPLIRVGQGSTVTVVFRNRIDRPSAVHWHGLRLDNRFDGAPGVTQAPVEPGDDFRYEVFFPDAGIYWYHPHVREDVQQDLGLAGNMLVTPADGGELPPVDREVVLSLDDLLLTEDGELVPWGDDAPVHALMGRFGNTFLVNGDPDWSMEVRAGEVVRFHLTNVSNARTYNLSFLGGDGGHPRIKVVGSDVGPFEREAWVESVVVAPAERYTVDVRFDGGGGVGGSGEVLLLNRIQEVNHVSGTYRPRTDTLGVVRLTPGAASPATGSSDASDASRAFDSLRVHAGVVAEIDRFRRHFDRPVDHTLELLLEARGPARTFLTETAAGYAPLMEWNDGMPMMNRLTTGGELSWTIRDADTGLRDMAIDWRFAVGEVAKVRIVNRSDELHPMNHPFHFHGQRFLVLSRNGVESPNLVWKDTAVVAAGETVDVLIEMSNPGRWMAHCHIAEHLSTGMMMTFRVDP